MRARVLVTVVGLTLWWSALPVGAQGDPEPNPPTINAPDCGGGIIPDPAEGCGPETPGDPGGWQQLTLLLVILVALVAIGLLVRRQVKQAVRLREIEVGRTP